jgi:murein DD-endopeptidase MepM/ murein hydrolase activator NlpD
MKDMTVTLNKPALGAEERAEKDRNLRKACKEFESVLTNQLLKSMRGTIDKCDLFHGGQEEEIYESLLDQELSKRMAGNGAKSLAELLYFQLKERFSTTEAEGAEAASGDPLKGIKPRWPVKARVSSDFGWRKDPFNGEKRFHKGIDLAANEGTPVRAAMPGRVVKSEYQKGYGNVVLVDHGHGFTTLYAHNQENLVREGDWVRTGVPVAKAGSTGRSTGSHLHFEVRRHGRHIDPMAFLGSEPTET